MKSTSILILVLLPFFLQGQMARGTVIEFSPIHLPSPTLSTQELIDIYNWKREQAIRECVHQFSTEVLRKRNSGELEIIDSFTPESSWIEYLELLKFKESDGTLVIMVAKGTPYVFKMHGLYYFLWKRADSPGDYYHNEVKNEKKFLIATLCEESGN